MSAEASSSPKAAVDGRVARRERGRLAVTNAVIDLVFEGHSPPAADQITERAGVSTASLFRYFETLDELREHATRHYFERFSHLFTVPNIGIGTLEERIDSFVEARADQHQTTAPMARLMRYKAFEVSELDATLHRLRATQADQVRMHFDHELERLNTEFRGDAAATITTATSFESWDQFSNDHGRSQAQIKRAWIRTVGLVLGQTGS